MLTYISLLRGINVSGQKKIKMADLRVHFEAIDFTDVQSYIQSGNLIFNSTEKDESAIAKKIFDKIQKEYGFDVSILIRTEKAFTKVLKKNPFLKDDNIDPKMLHLTFLGEIPDKKLVKELNEYEDPNDEFILDKQTLYVHCPNGYGRTKLHNNFFERKLKVSCTTRNWRSVNKIFDLIQERK